MHSKVKRLLSYTVRYNAAQMYTNIVCYIIMFAIGPEIIYPWWNVTISNS